MVFQALVRLFLRDLVRRRLLWILVFLALGGAALSYWAGRSIDQAMGNGATWEMATRRAASGLEELASTVRAWVAIVVVVFSAQVAPESRRNGTTQFVLSMGIPRDVLAAAQFAALALVLAAATLVTHVGFSIAGLETQALTVREAALSWPWLYLPLLGVAATAHALSLTASAVETYLVLIGVPFVARTLPWLMHGLPGSLPAWTVRLLDNVSLFFPSTSEIVAWPHLSFGAPAGLSSLTMMTLHAAAAVAFWVVLGLCMQRWHDFGSRTAVK
jgi:hypothetical protein